MLELIKSQRFQEELQRYREKIKNISNESVKKELENLINKLIKEVKMLDNYHQQLNTGKSLPIHAADTKNQISQLRKLINKKIEDYSSKS
jgi:hypothetical protein